MVIWHNYDIWHLLSTCLIRSELLQYEDPSGMNMRISWWTWQSLQSFDMVLHPICWFFILQSIYVHFVIRTPPMRMLTTLLTLLRQDVCGLSSFLGPRTTLGTSVYNACRATPWALVADTDWCLRKQSRVNTLGMYYGSYYPDNSININIYIYRYIYNHIYTVYIYTITHIYICDCIISVCFCIYIHIYVIIYGLWTHIDRPTEVLLAKRFENTYILAKTQDTDLTVGQVNGMSK
jgi:hypothetical protein